MFESLVRAFGVIGSLYVLRWLWRVFHSTVYVFYLAFPKDLKKLADAEWAVITGATDGIGRAYAVELAAHGFNLVLISRTVEKLERTAAEIRAEHSVEIRTIAFDFANPSVAAYEAELLPRLRELQIGVLINNVGLSYAFPDRLDRVDGGAERLANVAIVNVLPVTLLCASLLGRMAERGRGVVVNLSSAAANRPVVNWGVYSASKQYVLWLSRTLRKDYAGTGITIQTVLPMMVATSMSKQRPSLFVPDARSFARSALRTIGHVAETSGFFFHQLQSVGLFELLPEWLFDFYARRNARAVRERALRKRRDVKME